MKLLIDPAHGGSSPGVRSKRTGLVAKDVNLIWADELSAQLTSPTFLTRSEDIYLTNGQRAKQLRAYDAGIMVDFGGAERKVGPRLLKCPTCWGFEFGDENADAPADDCPFLVLANRGIAGSWRLGQALGMVLAERGVEHKVANCANQVWLRQRIPAVIVRPGHLTNPYTANSISVGFIPFTAAAVAEAFERFSAA